VCLISLIRKSKLNLLKLYEVLKASLTTDEPLLFIDAVHPTQVSKVTSGWIKTGVDKPIETTGSRT